MFDRFFKRRSSQNDNSHHHDPSNQLPPSTAPVNSQKLTSEQKFALVRELGITVTEGPNGPEITVMGDDDLDMARISIAARDFTHAGEHLGYAIAANPTDPEIFRIIDIAIREAGEQAADLLAPQNQSMFIGTVALRAYALMKIGQFQEASYLLIQIILSAPNPIYGEWYVQWMHNPAFAQAIDIPNIVGAFIEWNQRYTGTYIISPDIRNHIECILPTLQSIIEQYSDNSFFLFLYSVLLRKSGHFHEALEIAQQSAEDPGKLLIVAAAMAYQGLEMFDDAIALYQQGLPHVPENADKMNDIGELFYKKGDLAQSLYWYEESLRVDPKDPFHIAKIRSLYLRAVLYPDQGGYEKLELLSRKDEKARFYFSRLAMPYFGKRPNLPGEFLSMMQEAISGGSLPNTIATTGIVFPSLLLACHLEFPQTRFEIQYTSLPDIDLRVPLIDDPTVVLWRYEETQPIANIEPASRELAEAIAAIARTPYHLDRWNAPLRKLVTSFGGPSVVQGLLGVMVHPPVLPSDLQGQMHTWDWIFAVQMACTMGIVYSETGWDGTQRRAILRSLAYGPVDTTVITAIIALAEVTILNETAYEDYEAISLELICRAPSGWEPYEALMYAALVANRGEHLKPYIEAFQKKNHSR
jgi:tetratricopeptide (TPR) repeat protein